MQLESSAEIGEDMGAKAALVQKFSHMIPRTGVHCNFGQGWGGYKPVSQASPPRYWDPRARPTTRTSHADLKRYTSLTKWPTLGKGVTPMGTP